MVKYKTKVVLNAELPNIKILYPKKDVVVIRGTESSITIFIGKKNDYEQLKHFHNDNCADIEYNYFLNSLFPDISFIHGDEGKL